MRNGVFSLIVVVLVGFGFADLAAAQGQGGRGGRGGAGAGFGRMGQVQLLGNPQVQKELKLADDQIAKIKEVSDASRPQRGQRGNNNNQRPTEEERAARRKTAEESAAKATDILNAEQKTRFQQIRIWTEGSRALTDDEDVAKKLGLTDDQKSALKTIGDESNKKRGEIAQGMRGASEEARKKITDDLAALRKSTEAECMAVLTDDQKSKFDALRGPKFELDQSAFGGGGRRGRGG
ncbi:MAG: Spy/CpxP family protein refolding chaperone, partial [Planctomycetes bacterium]|nr:Spy/CpxP family protein refolding chaperone [Planctomycetota bacterium]